MKRNILILSLFILCACSQKIYQNKAFIEGNVFKGKRGPLFGANVLSFDKDSAFTFIRHGPSILISKGIWQYNNIKKVVILQSQKPEEKYNGSESIDTLWISFNQTEVKVISSKKLTLDSIYYYKE